MVEPATLLGLAVGGVLALIGGYVIWLDGRLRELEARMPANPQVPAGVEHEADDPPRDAHTSDDDEA